MILKKKIAPIIMTAVVAFLFVATPSAMPQSPRGEVIVALPFENCGQELGSRCHIVERPEYNWIGESFADSLSALFKKFGYLTTTSDDRAVAYQRLRLPRTVVPSRATAIKVARELHASLLVTGIYSVTVPPTSDSKTEEQQTNKPVAMIVVDVRVIRVNEGLWTGESYSLGGPITDLQSMQGDTAYEVLYASERAVCQCPTPPLPFRRKEFQDQAKKSPPLAFEALIKALLLPEDHPARPVYLENARRLYAKDKGGEVYAEAVFQLGEYYFNKSQWKEAIEYFTMLQKTDPHYNEAQFYAGLAYWKVADLDHAQTALVPLADENVLPWVAVYNNAGAVLTEAARKEKNAEERTKLLQHGIKLLSRAADSSPDDATVLFNYAYALFLSEKYAESADKLQKVIAGDQKDGVAFFLLAKAQELANQTEAAKAAENLARKNLQTYAKWEIEWEKSKSLSNLALRSRDTLSRSDLSDFDRSKQAEEANEYRVKQSLDKIRDLYQEGRDDEAMSEIRKLFSLEPTNAEGFLFLGRINQRRSDQDAAIAALKTAIFWENTHPLIDAHILLGRIFLERGDLGEARKYAASAIRIDPDNQEAMALQRQVTMGRPE